MSIGCEPCTSKTKDSIRDGRWSKSMKTECGIHTSKKENEKYFPTN